MRHARAYGLAGLAALAVAAAAVAQTTVTPVPDPAPVQVAPLAGAEEHATWGDPKKGQSLAGACAESGSAIGYITAAMPVVRAWLLNSASCWAT